MRLRDYFKQFQGPLTDKRNPDAWLTVSIWPAMRLTFSSSVSQWRSPTGTFLRSWDQPITSLTPFQKKKKNDEPKRVTWLVGLTANDDLKTLLTDSLLTVIIGNGDWWLNMSGALAGRPIKASHTRISDTKTPSLKYPASRLMGNDDESQISRGRWKDK